jgi:hypothetical protein
LFGRKSRRKSRAEKLRERASGVPLVPAASIAAFFTGARPVAERLLYDDNLRDNIRTFIDSAQRIYEELSGEDLDDIVARLWDDDKLRKQVEAAAGAAQEGRKRVRGERVGGRGSSGLVLLLLAAAVGFLFLNPRTGPQARRLAREAADALRA